MANLQKFRDYHYEATVKVSENIRTLALSAIGIVWIFKVEDGGHFSIPNGLHWPLLFVILALAFDFFQYVYRAIIWHWIFRKYETNELGKNINEDSPLYVSPYVNFPAYLFFYGKILFLSFSYIKLLYFFWCYFVF